MKLNLTAKNKEQELILEYLEKSASEELALLKSKRQRLKNRCL